MPYRIHDPMRREAVRHWLLALALSVNMGCAASFGDDQDAGLDAGSASIDATQAAADANEIDAALPLDGGLRSVTLQAGDNSISPQNAVSCNGGAPDFFHSDNRYFRSYELTTAGITTDFAVTSVDVGIEDAAALSGSQPLTVRIYSLTGPLLLANLTELAAVSVDVPNQNLTLLNVPITAIVPAGSTLVVEAESPDGQAASNRFFIGSNQLSQAFPSFIVASTCNILEPTATSQLGVPDLLMSIVLNVSGDHTSP